MDPAADPIARVLGPGGLLAAVLGGYEDRPQQVDMARAVERALRLDQPLLVEAGTGTGKTLAYLIPAILSGRKVIVSTGTRNLQEQIYGKDVPFLLKHLGLPFEAAVLKGISNYVCLRRLAQLGDTGEPDLVRIARWAPHAVAGDRAELPDVPEDAAAWRDVTTTPEGRLGPKCAHFERCFVTRARRAAQSAQIVIVNHHLFFADLALRAHYPGAQVLPAYEAVIFDEAHQIEEVATEHFGLSVSTLRVAALLRDAAKALGDDAAPRLLAHVERTGECLFSLVRRRLRQAGAREMRIATPADLFRDPDRQAAWFALDTALEELEHHAGRLGEKHDDEDQEAIARRAGLLRRDLAALAEHEEARKFVHWAELRGRSVFLRASPIDVAPLLREHLFEAHPATVLTSATLTTAGTFDYLRERVGLSPEVAEELVVDSPFDYPRQALLYLPRDLPGPKEPGFGDAVVARVRELVTLTAGRAFVLFTSYRALEHAAGALRGDLAYPVLVQGEAPRPALLESFRTTPGAVLLATSSFWEGVDVPGDALSLVVLEKLPFAAPDDPLTRARVEALEARGEEPFMRYQVPKAALFLKQGFGRLIRRRDDRGIVAILDHRIVTRGYGSVFLRSLPPARRTSSLEQVRRWWDCGA